ncbi:hypothetical protein BRADI_1g24793v3, partial [Brachypodium distachyon]
APSLVCPHSTGSRWRRPSSSTARSPVPPSPTASSSSARATVEESAGRCAVEEAAAWAREAGQNDEKLTTNASARSETAEGSSSATGGGRGRRTARGRLGASGAWGRAPKGSSCPPGSRQACGGGTGPPDEEIARWRLAAGAGEEDVDGDDSRPSRTIPSVGKINSTRRSF